MKKHNFRVLIGYPNLSMMLTPSSAVGLFTAILKKEGYEVDLFDCTPYLQDSKFIEDKGNTAFRANIMGNSRRFDADALFGEGLKDMETDFANKLDNFKPHAIIFSTVVEDTVPQLKQLFDVLDSYSEIPTLVGGVAGIMASEMMMEINQIKCMGIGEGEEIIVEFCERVRTGTPTTDIHGTWAKDDEGNIIKNLHRPLVNINNVIADYSLFDPRRFYRPIASTIWNAIPIETYRGCPYTCTFCNSPTQVTLAKEREQGNYLRRKSMEQLRKEISEMIELYQMEFLYINDDAFMSRPKQEIKAFAEMYKEFKIPFWFQTRFEDISSESLEWLAEVGAYRNSFGLEHGNEKFRKEKLHRNISNEKILKQASIAASVGIPYTLNNIIGMPYETRDLLFESINFNREIGSYDSVSVNIFVPYRGTILRELALKEGWLDENRQTLSLVANSILEMPEPYLSGEEINSLQRVFNMYVEFPKERWPDIKIAEKIDDEGESMFEKLSEEYYEVVWGQTKDERLMTYIG